MHRSQAGEQARLMMAPLRTTLVIPCYNEVARLDAQAFRAFLSDRADVNFLFVDDGSSDGTAVVLQRICTGFEARARTLTLPRNQGKAEAVRAGINHAMDHLDQQVVGYWDADLATPLDSVPRLVAVLERQAGIDMVFGSRVKLLGHDIERVPLRHYLSRIFVTAVSLTLRLPIYDSQCGAKLFRVDDRLRRAFAAPFLSRWVFDVEILARFQSEDGANSATLAARIYECPLERWIDVSGSKIRLLDFALAFIDLVRIKRRYLRHRAR